jgi:outer membrane protein OmpA-like peptidoglycan-associated protein
MSQGIGWCRGSQTPMDLVKSTHWAIASVTSKGAAGFSATIFDLVNLHSFRAQRLRVVGSGVGKGFPVSYSPSSSMSNYAYFTTDQPVNFDDFDGVGARMIGGSAVLYSWCSLTLWAGPAYIGKGLATARMSGWGLATPNLGVDHGYTEIIYCDGDPVGVLETAVEIDIPTPPEQLDTRVQITVKDDSMVVILRGDVLFDFDKSAIKPEAKIPLTQAAAVIAAWRRPKSTVLVDGFTDNIGSDAYNLNLSKQRASAAAEWFTSRKYLPSTAIRSDGFGKLYPIAPNTDEAGRAKNRRVEIYVSNP